MRRIIFLIFVPLSYLISIPFLGLAFLIGFVNQNAKMKIAYTFNSYFGWLFLTISGAKFKTYGLENIPSDKTVLYVSNHRSMLDIPTIVRFSKVPLNFVAKDSLKKMPVFGWWIIANNALLLDRSSPREGLKTILKGIERIKAGETFVIYPEGTRSKTDDFLPFKQGSLKLASKANVPVIPVAIRGTADVFENNGFNLKAKTIYFSVGEPIDLNTLSDEDKKHSAIYVQNVIKGMYDKLVAQQKLDYPK